MPELTECVRPGKPGITNGNNFQITKSIQFSITIAVLKIFLIKKKIFWTHIN